MDAPIRTTIDGAGRIVIPKTLREAAGLWMRDEVEVRLSDGGVIEISAVPRSVHLEDRDGFQVVVPDDPGPALDDGVVSETRRSLRRHLGEDASVGG